MFWTTFPAYPCLSVETIKSAEREVGVGEAGTPAFLTVKSRQWVWQKGLGNDRQGNIPAGVGLRRT